MKWWKKHWKEVVFHVSVVELSGERQKWSSETSERIVQKLKSSSQAL